MYFESIPFLAHPYSLAFAMNIDWFQPYKWTESSVGAIYLTVLNLPYHLRFKREFVILVGIILGPREPKRDINLSPSTCWRTFRFMERNSYVCAWGRKRAEHKGCINLCGMRYACLTENVGF